MSQNEIRETLSKNIKRYLNKYDMTQADLARKLGVSGQTITNWVNGGGEPRMNKIDKMCEIFHCKRSDLLEEPSACSGRAIPEIPGLFPVEVMRLPIIGHIACGEPTEAEEYIEGFAALGQKIDADFGLVAEGDSMINARIRDKDLVFVKSTSHVENGQIAIVRIGDETTLKRFYFYPDVPQIILRPENPAYSEIVYTGESMNEVRVIGRAVAVQCPIM